MKKILSTVFFGSLGLIAAVPAAMAVCPVCTVAVGAGLEGMRLLGVDDVITGIWAGALTLSLFLWTVSWLKKRNTLWGMDKFLLGIIVGTIAFYGGARWYVQIKRKNGGHAQFAFQKVVVPLSFLVIATVVFWIITM